MKRTKCLAAAVLFYGIMGMNTFALSTDDAANTASLQKRPILSRLVRIPDFATALNLSDKQKCQIREILAKNRAQILQAVHTTLQARIELNGGNPEGIEKLANARIPALQLKREIMEQIKPILNAHQLSLISKRQLEKEQRLRNFAAKLESRMAE